MWHEGTIRIGRSIFQYWVKHYDEPSHFGIGNGRISKLMLKLDGEIIANYDRGWDVDPTTEEANLALCILLNEHN